MTSAPIPKGIRAARPEDRTAIIEVARDCGLFPADELADVEGMLDAFLTGAAEHEAL